VELEWKRPVHKGWRTRLFLMDCNFPPPTMRDSLSFVCKKNDCFDQRSFVDFLSKYMLIVNNDQRSQRSSLSNFDCILSQRTTRHAAQLVGTTSENISVPSLATFYWTFATRHASGHLRGTILRADPTKRIMPIPSRSRWNSTEIQSI
jgi:hypothetical protein